MQELEYFDNIDDMGRGADTVSDELVHASRNQDKIDTREKLRRQFTELLLEGSQLEPQGLDDLKKDVQEKIGEDNFQYMNKILDQFLQGEGAGGKGIAGTFVINLLLSMQNSPRHFRPTAIRHKDGYAIADTYEIIFAAGDEGEAQIFFQENMQEEIAIFTSGRARIGDNSYLKNADRLRDIKVRRGDNHYAWISDMYNDYHKGDPKTARKMLLLVLNRVCQEAEDNRESQERAKEMLGEGDVLQKMTPGNFRDILMNFSLGSGTSGARLEGVIGVVDKHYAKNIGAHSFCGSHVYSPDNKMPSDFAFVLDKELDDGQKHRVSHYTEVKDKDVDIEEFGRTVKKIRQDYEEGKGNIDGTSEGKVFYVYSGSNPYTKEKIDDEIRKHLGDDLSSEIDVRVLSVEDYFNLRFDSFDQTDLAPVAEGVCELESTSRGSQGLNAFIGLLGDACRRQ